MSKRGEHEGSFRRRGDAWQGRIMLGGKSYTATGGSRREAVEKIQTIAARFYEGTLDTKAITLGEWLETWQRRGAVDWKLRTQETYANIVNKHLAPVLGHVPLPELSPGLIAECFANSKAPAPTRQKMYRVLHRALRVAVYDGLLSVSPCAVLNPPLNRRVVHPQWSAEMAADFLKGTEAVTGGILWLILIGTGCRLGEALALTWGDIHAGEVQIHGTMEESLHGKRVTTPKNETSARVVQLPPGIAVLIENRRRSESDRVVVTARGTTPNRALCRRWLRRECEKMNLRPIRIHDMRHLHASILIEAGVPITEVAHRLGHASPAVTTSVYAHFLRGDSSASALAIDRALG